MSYSYQAHTTSASNVTYTFSFAGDDPGYISTSAILVEVRESGDTEWSELSDTLWNLTGTNQITLVTAIAAPADGLNNLRIRRVVDKDKPYASFVRGSMLDMVNLDRSFIQLLEGLQEILDGFFPVGFYFQQNMNMNGHKFYNLGAGTESGDSVNFEQLTAVDSKHTTWNTEQDAKILSLLSAGITGGVAYIPYTYTASEGDLIISPPYTFGAARVSRNGVVQNELNGDYSVSNNKITLTSPLRSGDVLRCELGPGWAP